MSAALDPRQWLQGPLAPYAACVLLDAAPEAADIPADQLGEPDTLNQALAVYAARHPGAPRRALVSQWLKRYLANLLIPQAGLMVVAGWRLPQAASELSLRLNALGEVAAFHYPHAGAPLPTDADTASRWLPLLVGHLAPLITALAKHGRVSARVLWNNVGNLLEAIFSQLAQLPQAPAWLAEDRSALLEAANWPDGQRNPLRNPVHYIAPLLPELMNEPTRLRRHCCLRHEIPGIVYCATCPHLCTLSRGELTTLLDKWHHEA